MNPKAIVNRKIDEAEDLPIEPGRDNEFRQRSFRSRMHSNKALYPADDADTASDVQRLTGQQETPRNQFTPKEAGQLKDIMILMLAKLMQNETDSEIGQKLMKGHPLQPGELQHIIDEAGHLELPPSHSELIRKISQLAQP